MQCEHKSNLSLDTQSNFFAPHPQRFTSPRGVDPSDKATQEIRGIFSQVTLTPFSTPTNAKTDTKHKPSNDRPLDTVFERLSPPMRSRNPVPHDDYFSVGLRRPSSGVSRVGSPCVTGKSTAAAKPATGYYENHANMATDIYDEAALGVFEFSPPHSMLEYSTSDHDYEFFRQADQADNGDVFQFDLDDQAVAQDSRILTYPYPFDGHD